MRSTTEKEELHKTNKKKIRIFCPECKSKNLEFGEYETVCRDCGLVLQGVPSIEKYPHGYIIQGKRAMYTIIKKEPPEEGK